MRVRAGGVEHMKEGSCPHTLVMLILLALYLVAVVWYGYGGWEWFPLLIGKLNR